MSQTAIDHQKQHFWRNYLTHTIEGGLYMGGLTFLASETLLPSMVNSLGGPTWLVSLMPVLIYLGFMATPLFTSHWVEQMKHVKPFVATFGVFQRIPVLVAGLILWFYGSDNPTLALWTVALSPLLQGLLGGVAIGAWMELVTRIIPANRRASSWAIRYIIATLIGVPAGIMIKHILDAYPGAPGYAILHFCTFACTAVSFIIFMMEREIIPPELSKIPPKTSLAQHLGNLPELIRSDRILLKFLIMRFASTGLLITLPFMAIHATEVTGNNESFIGYLVAAQMIGGFFGNIIGGYLGDRFGAKNPLFIGKSLIVAMSILLIFNTSEVGFYIIYALFGAGFYINNISGITLGQEIAPVSRRPTYLSLFSMAAVPGILIATTLSTVIRNLTGSITIAALLTALTTLLSVVMLVQIPEPRKT